MGFNRSMLAITVFSVVASVVLTYPLLLYFDVPDRSIFNALIMAVMVPLVVAPVVSYVGISLVFELEEARVALARLASHDGLTGVFNRRHFDSRLVTEGSRAIRSNLTMSVLMIDVDEFKTINDQHGHAAGDTVLQQVAAACAACLRPYDMFARYGGEEFIALLPTTSGAQACEIAERIRAAVSQLHIVSPLGQHIPVTVSLGVGALLSGDVNTDAVLSRADQAMYEAKRAGRNRWVCQQGASAAP